MRTDRSYRKALPFPQARQELVDNAGLQFDPHLIEVFLRIVDRLPEAESASSVVTEPSPSAAPEPVLT